MMIWKLVVLSAVLITLSCSAKYREGSTEFEMGVRGKIHIEYRQ